MTTLAILQARMSSNRFPGKVLAPLAGEPMILRQIERLRRATLIDGLVVATSTHVGDDDLVRILEAAGVPVVRGSLENVLGRFLAVLDDHPADAVVRLTADCPLASPSVIDDVVRLFDASGADYASNTMTPTYPDGLDAEVVRTSVLREVARLSEDSAEREHVTLGVYRRPDRYRIENLAGDRDLSNLRWTVDTPEDHAFVAGVYDELYDANPAFDVDEILAYLERHPDRSRTTADAARNAALEGLDTGAMNA